MTPLCLMLMTAESLACPLLPSDSTIPLTEPQIYAVLERAGWPEPLWDEAAAVSFCESRWTPAAHAPGAYHYGLFQLNYYQGVNPPRYPGWRDWLREAHGFEGNPLDAVDNATAARLIFEHSGWRNWDYCRPDR